MLIEFRKVAQTPKSFNDEVNSVSIEGTFCKISSKLVEMDSKIFGKAEVDCSKCGKTFETDFDEEIEFLISDGLYNQNDNSQKNFEKVIIEVDDHLIDFQKIIKSELESFKLDYHRCDNCLDEEV